VKIILEEPYINLSDRQRIPEIYGIYGELDSILVFSFKFVKFQANTLFKTQNVSY